MTLERATGSRMDAASRITVRAATPADLDPLRWVIYRAYYEVLLSLYGAESAYQYEVRSLDFMAMYLRRDAAGSLVAVTEDDSIAGGVFCFAWGEVGWFGSLAVAPEWQGKGVGQQLTRRAVEYLRGRGCRRIGLETWPDAPLTRHLYGKLGFDVCRPTLKLSRPVGPRLDGEPAILSRFEAPRVQWVRAGEPQALAAALDLVSAAGDVTRGPDDVRVDYRQEVLVAVSCGFAEVETIEDAERRPLGFALCYVRKPSGTPMPALDLRLLVLVPGAEERALATLLDECDERARRLGGTAVTCDVNLRFSRAAARLRRHGFRPIYELVRMEQPVPGIDVRARSTVFECARWAG